MERIQKILSAAGLCSRRQAEQYISEGRVTVNGIVASLGEQADPNTDQIMLDGTSVSRVPAKVYLVLNKPRGYVTTLSDEKGRHTVAELVRDCGERVYPVGRLDMDSDGLLILTNDGDFAHRLTHPSHEMDKEYLVTVGGELSGCVGKLAALTTLEDGSPIVPAQVRVVKREAGRWVLSVVIHQGLNRQIRRMCAMVGLKVLRLQRVREGAVHLGNLAQGKWRVLTQEERVKLLS